MHVLVLAPGDQVTLHWQQPGLQPTVTETRSRPSSDEPLATVMQLSPWLAHAPTCARVTGQIRCDCGLNALVRPLGWSI